MSRAATLKRNHLDRMTEKYIGKSKKDVFHSLSGKKVYSIMENVSKDSIVEILDQILEYSTRSKKDLDTDNAEMLKVDLAQIISFADQLKSLIDEDGGNMDAGMDTGDTGGDTETEEVTTETTTEETAAGPE